MLPRGKPSPITRVAAVQIPELKGNALISIVPYGVSNLLSAIASLLSIILLSRLLSAEAYGYYATILALTLLCQTAGFNWIQTSIIRLYLDETDQAGRDRFAQAVRVGFGLSAVFVCVAWIIGLLLYAASPDAALLGIAGLSVLLSRSWAEIGQNWNRVMERPWHFAAAQALQSLGALALAVAGLLWWSGNPIIPLAALVIASLLASAIALTGVGGAAQGFRQLQPRLREMWRYGAPITAVSLAFVILTVSDRLLITSILGPAAAGAYAAAFGIASRALGMLLLPIALATKPQVFIEFNRRGAESTGRFLKRVSAWLIAAGLPITTLLVCAPATLASVIVGHELASGAAKVLPWTAAGALLSSFLTLHFGLAFQIARQTRWMFFAVAPAAAFNVLCNVLLLPRFGIVAAGWSMVASYAMALALTVLFGSRHFRVPFSVSDAFRTAVACAPLVAFLQHGFQPTPSGLSLMLGGGALVYASSALALNVAGSRTHLMQWFGKPEAPPA